MPGATQPGVWDTVLGDTTGQAGPGCVTGSDSRWKIVSVAKQNCIENVSALMLDLMLLGSPGGAVGPWLMGTEVQNTSLALEYVRKLEL